MNTTNQPTTVMNILTAIVIGLLTYLIMFNPLGMQTLYLALSSVGLIILGSFFFFKTSTGISFFHFAKETRIELIKVVWPTRPDIRKTTIIIFIAVFITAVFLWLVDSFFSYLVQAITA